MEIPGYRIEGELGKGGMGAVYRAVQLSVNRPVALKVLPLEHRDEVLVRRFEREARLAAQLEHPNVVRIYDTGIAGEYHYIAMQLVEGDTLRKLLRKGPLHRRRILAIVQQVGAALDAAHQRKIYHRDVKPENIMCQPDGTVLLMDFGIARGAEDTNLTGNQALGTAFYMAPEQWTGREVSAATDVYALAVMLFEMLTGKMPFEGPGTNALMYQHLQQPPPVADYRGILGPSLEGVLLQALNKDPSLRFPGTPQFVAAVEMALDPAAAAGAGTTSPTRGRAGVAPDRRVLIGAGAAAAVLVLGGGGVMLLNRGHDDPPRNGPTSNGSVTPPANTPGNAPPPVAADPAVEKSRALVEAFVPKAEQLDEDMIEMAKRYRTLAPEDRKRFVRRQKLVAVEIEQKAKEAIEACKSSGPAPPFLEPAYVHLARVRRYQDRYREALAAAELGLQQFPQSGDLALEQEDAKKRLSQR